MIKKSQRQSSLAKRSIPLRMIDNPSVWQQLPAIIIYPLQGHALPLIIIFSLMLWIGLQSPLGIPAFAIIVSWSFKYAYGVLEHTQLGYATPPMLTFELWNPTQQRPLKQLFYLLLVFAISEHIEKAMGSVPALIILALGILFTPASAVIIASQNNLLLALNPVKLVRLVISIGSPYLLISLLFALITFLSLPIPSQIPLLSVFVPNPGWTVRGLALLLLIVGILYLLIMTFHLLGFVVYHRRQTLGLEVWFSPEREQELERQEREKHFNRVVDEVYWLARQPGQISVAIDTLVAQLPELGDTLDTHEKLFARISLWEDQRVALAQAQYYLRLLIQNQQLNRALAVYQICLKQNAGFELNNPSQILPLANQAYHEKNYVLALHLIQNLTTRYPNHPNTVALQLLKAQILAEHCDRVNEAKVIISQLLERKQHHLYPEIRKYAIFLAKFTQLRKI